MNTGGAAIPFGGLAQGGGGAGGVQLDVKNFCCPEYLCADGPEDRQNWNARQGAGGKPTIKFTIRRDRMLTNVELEKPSGQELLDLEARRAVIRTQQLPPLPREFTESSLTVHLTFDFQRYDLTIPSPRCRLRCFCGCHRHRRTTAARSAGITAAAAKRSGIVIGSGDPACRRRSPCRPSLR